MQMQFEIDGIARSEAHALTKNKPSDPLHLQRVRWLF